MACLSTFSRQRYRVEAQKPRATFCGWFEFSTAELDPKIELQLKPSLKSQPTLDPKTREHAVKPSLCVDSRTRSELILCVRFDRASSTAVPYSGSVHFAQRMKSAVSIFGGVSSRLPHPTAMGRDGLGFTLSGKIGQAWGPGRNNSEISNMHAMHSTVPGKSALAL